MSGRSPGGGHGNRLQYSCLENPMDRGAWWATVHGVTKSQTRLKRLSTQHVLCVLLNALYINLIPTTALWKRYYYHYYYYYSPVTEIKPLRHFSIVTSLVSDKVGAWAQDTWLQSLHSAPLLNCPYTANCRIVWIETLPYKLRLEVVTFLITHSIFSCDKWPLINCD